MRTHFTAPPAQYVRKRSELKVRPQQSEWLQLVQSFTKPWILQYPVQVLGFILAKQPSPHSLFLSVLFALKKANP
jgi:hypothetical protein